MKILYAIQGTGNGHITRAIEIIPYLQKKGDLDILVSGIQSDIELPFKIKYKLNGLSFIFGKQGGVDIWKTYWKMNSNKLRKEIKALDVTKYDLIINDFEPVSAWAAIRDKKPCIGLSNQVATLHPLAPKPKKSDLIGKLVLQKYAPTSFNYGFHFKSIDNNIYTPVIRKEVRALTPTHGGHYTVYLPSYDDERILKHLKKINTVDWEVFSKHCKKRHKVKNIKIMPINQNQFLKSMASCEGVLCNAGFATTSEALFLKKKLLIIPMKKQYEQHCNAEMLKSMGVKSIKKLNFDNLYAIHDWIKSKKIVNVDYPDITEKIINTIFENHAGKDILDNNFIKTNYNLFQ